MSNLFKYKISLDADSFTEERDGAPPPYAIPSVAFVLVCTITTIFFSAIVMILNYFFSDSLNGTYLKLFF